MHGIGHADDEGARRVMTLQDDARLVVRRRRGGAAWPQARRVARAAGRPLPAERLPLAGALGRVLAADLVALSDLPVADTSAMDGWAVAGPAPWRVVGELPADRVMSASLALGTCVAIATGAVVPSGTAAVLPIEHSLRDADGVRPDDPARPHRTHIRPAGEESRAGDVLLRRGTVVTPPVLGLAAATGHDDLLVGAAATVEVLVLGDELSERGLPAPGLVRDALGPQLPAWLTAFGTAAPRVRHLPDVRRDLDDALRDTRARLVVTTGGTGPGPRDHVRAAVLRAGGEVLVDGVDVKPGHPMLLASLPDGRWLAGLPGNPLAACVALVTLVSPLLDALHGRPAPADVTVILGGDEPGRPGDGHRLLPVRLEGTRAVVLPSCGAAMLRGLAQATGLAVVPPEGALTGDAVAYLPLPWGG